MYLCIYAQKKINNYDIIYFLLITILYICELFYLKSIKLPNVVFVKKMCIYS